MSPMSTVRISRADAAGVRPARFVPRASIPVAAACLVANGLRETLRELLGERCVSNIERMPLRCLWKMSASFASRLYQRPSGTM